MVLRRRASGVLPVGVAAGDLDSLGDGAVSAGSGSEMSCTASCIVAAPSVRSRKQV